MAGLLVGGRIETVAPRKSLFAPDYLRIAILLAVSAAIHLWLIAHTVVTARDGIGFARYALALQSPQEAGATSDPTRTALNVIAQEKQAPGYPAAIWMVAKIVQQVHETPNPSRRQLADQYLLSAQIVSGLAAFLLVIPHYLIGRMLFGRFVGFAAALLFQILPTPAHLTSDGLSEGFYLLAMSVAVLLAIRTVRRPGVGGFLACGLAVGCSYLIRPEGLMVALAVGVVAGWAGLIRAWPRDLTIGRLIALGIGVALVAGPYVILIGKLTNKPTAKHILDGVNPREELLKGHSENRGEKKLAAPILARSWTIPDQEGAARVIVPAVLSTIEEITRGLQYFGAGLALIGIIVFRRRIVVEPGLALLVVLMAVNVVVLIGLGAGGYFVTGSRTFYVSGRHTMFIAMLSCIFAAASLEPITSAFASLPMVGRFWRVTWAPQALLSVIAAAMLPITLKPLHAHRVGHKIAGEWLAENLKEGDCLIDPFEWAQWYSGRSLYFVIPDPKIQLVTYAVVDDDKDHEKVAGRLDRMNEALNVVKDSHSTVVYHWPENEPIQSARVKIYRLIRSLEQLKK